MPVDGGVAYLSHGTAKAKVGAVTPRSAGGHKTARTRKQNRGLEDAKCLPEPAPPLSPPRTDGSGSGKKKKKKKKGGGGANEDDAAIAERLQRWGRVQLPCVEKKKRFP